MEYSKSNNSNEERTSYQFNHKILLVTLLAMTFILTTYFWSDEREEFSESFWMMILAIWYVGISASLFLVFKKRRVGYLVSGILGLATIAFWTYDSIHLVFDITLLLPEPNLQTVIRNFIGIIISGFLVFSSHNAFHKISTINTH